MQIVIDIPDDDYNVILENVNFYIEKHWGLPAVWDAIVKGTPLPKGHGDLIDRDYFIDKYVGCGSVYCEDNSCNECNSRIVSKFDVDNAPVVIPADK